MRRRPRIAAAATRPRHMAIAAALTGLALLLAACGSSEPPQWQPQQTLTNAPLPHPQLPTPEQMPGGGGGEPPSPGTTDGVPSPEPSDAVDPAVLATNLASPAGIAMLPDGSALVGERTTGRIVKVQPVAGQPVTQVAQIDGIDAGGDGGLLDLALSPTYAQDGLVLAYVTTAEDNRVVHLSLGGVATPIVTGIPRGAAGNAGRIAFDGAGHLYIATGDAGDPAAAADPASLAGKILRTDDLGRPLADNPDPASRTWASGPADVRGLCVNPLDGTVFAVAGDRAIYQATAGALLAPAGSTPPLASSPDTWAQPTGCAVANNALYLSTGDGKALISASLVPTTGPLGDFGAVMADTYGRLRTVVAAPDNALWLATDNLPPAGSPEPTDDRVIRLIDSSGGGGSVV